MRQPHVLDLFCGAGGAGEGYHRSGYHVVGCDTNIRALRENYHESYEDEAISVLDTLLDGRWWHGYSLTSFALIHASPPCQAYSTLAPFNSARGRAEHPRLIEPLRERLIATGLPYVIENVPGAPLLTPILLCGSMFGLAVRRHRLFETNVPIPKLVCDHKGQGQAVGVYGNLGQTLGRGTSRRAATVQEARNAMGISWMGRKTLVQAVPPAYTEYLGRRINLATA